MCIRDRFKIRHCMNIEGVVRQLPLFEPPIDPALLVQAVAAGVDLRTAIHDIAAATPHYRFSGVRAKAMDLAGGVTSLGAGLLAALEKRDGGALARMRSRNEIEA